jgi:hypothetical protein
MHTTAADPKPPATRSLVGICALAAPGLLFVYGLLRLIDGMDGNHGPGLAWNLGHAAFLVAFLLLGVLVVGLRRRIHLPTRGHTIVATTATVGALIGVAAFVRVILGDLFQQLDDAMPLPEPVYVAGPLLFQAGVLALLVLATLLPPKLPVWSPVLVFLGFVPIAVNLDLLPLGALLILIGLTPLARARRGQAHDTAVTRSA